MRIPFTNIRIRATIGPKRPRPSAWDDFWYGLQPYATASGIEVSETTALKFSPVYAGVRAIATSIASLPLNVYRTVGRYKEKAIDLPLYRILHLQPNPEQTRIQMWEALISHILLWGNCYAQIQSSLGGDVQALWPLDPSRMTVEREAGVLVYKYRLTDTGETITFPFWEILHIPGMGFNGTIGYSMVSLMRDSIGLGLAQEQFANRFFSNGATPGGVLETEQQLGEEGRENLKKSWYANHGGVTRQQGIAVLEQGLKFHAMSVAPKDAEWLDSRKFSVLEIARWLGVPPHMLSDLDRATWSNIEQQGLDFVIYTLTPWLERIEQSIETRLMLPPDLEVIHSVEGLLRGDSAARASLYSSGLLNGWLSINEVREFENMNPVEGGDEHRVQMQMTPTTKPAEEGPKKEGEERGTNGKDHTPSWLWSVEENYARRKGLDKRM